MVKWNKCHKNVTTFHFVRDNMSQKKEIPAVYKTSVFLFFDIGIYK